MRSAPKARPDLAQISSSAVRAIECVSRGSPLVAETVSRLTNGTSRSSTAGVPSANPRGDGAGMGMTLVIRAGARNEK